MDQPEAEGGIYAHESAFLDCWVQLGIAGEKVISVSFPDAPEPDTVLEHPLLDRIEAYLEGNTDDFTGVDVGLTVPTDRRNVLEAVRQVPYGENATVEQISRMVPGMAGDEDDMAVVREALADNPVPLIIPDHRVRDGPSGAPPTVEQKLRALEEL